MSVRPEMVAALAARVMAGIRLRTMTKVSTSDSSRFVVFFMYFILSWKIGFLPSKSAYWRTMSAWGEYIYHFSASLAM